MTAPTKPVAWMRKWEGDASDLGQMLFETAESELDDSPNWHPLYSASALQAAREEGCRAGIEAAAKAVRGHADDWKPATHDLSASAVECRARADTANDCATLIESLTPETVLKEKA